MSGSNISAAEAASGGFGGVGIASLINALAPIFLGSGKTTDQQQGVTTTGTTGTTTQQQGTTGTSTTTTTSDAGIIAQLLAAFNQAQGNAANPLASTQPLINEIIRQAQVAFGPTIANSNAAGIYNSPTLGLLAGRASAEAANAGAATALNFQTGQQQLAAQIGNALLGATKTQATTSNQQTGTTGTTAQQQQATTQQTGTKQTAPAVGSNILTPLLGIGGALFGPSLLRAGSKALGLGDTGDPFSFIKNLFNPATVAEPASGSTVDAALASINAAATGQAEGNAIGGLGRAVADPGVATGSAGALATPAEPSIEALAALAPPGTGAQALALGNLGAASINPQVATLPDPFSSFGTTAQGLNATIPGIPLDFGAGTSAEDAGNVLSALTFGGIPPDIAQFAGGGGAGIGGVAPSTFSGIQNVPAGVGLNAGGALDFGIPNAANIPSDIGNIFSSGEGFGQLGLDLANPLAGIAGGLLAKLIAPDTKAVGGGIGGIAGGLAGGAAGSALLGPALGSFAGPVGTLAGALIGTLLGGRIGPNAPNTYSFAGLKINPDGTVALGNQVQQAFGGGDVRGSLQTQVDALNTFLTSSGLKVANSTTTPQGVFAQLNGPGNFIIGDRGPLTLGIDQTKGTPQGPNLVGGISDAFGQLRFTSDNPQLAGLIGGKSFADPNALAAALTSTPSVTQTAPVIPTTPTSITTPVATPIVASSVASGVPSAGSFFGSGFIAGPDQIAAFLGNQIATAGGSTAVGFNAGGGTG